MKKRRLRSVLVGMTVCMMLTASPFAADLVSGSGTAAAATKGSADALVEHAVKHKGCKYNNFGDAKAFTTDWCAAFVQHCSSKTGAGKAIPTSGYNFVNDLSYNIVNSKGGKITFVNTRFYSAKYKNFSASARSQKRVVKNTSYKPRKGDLIIFSSDGSYWWTHVGIVRANGNSPTKNVPTIEGNTGSSNYRTSKVMQRSRTSSSGFHIVAYVTPKYTVAAPAAPAKYTHTITYNTNGGSGSYGTQNVQDGNQIQIPAAKPTKTGYTFQGWYAKRLSDNTWYVINSGKGWCTWNNIMSKMYTPKAYVPGQKYTLDDSWRKKSSDVNKDATKSNYTFFAQWKANTFTVKYDANGGNGNMSDTVHTYGIQKQISRNTFTREGYLFKGWNPYDARQNKWMYTNGTTTGWYKEGSAPAGYRLNVYNDAGTIAWTTAENNGIIVMSAVWEEDPDYVVEDPGEKDGEDVDVTEPTDVDVTEPTDAEETDGTDPEEQTDVQPVYEWTEWTGYSTSRPAEMDGRQIESKTEYRYRDKQTVKSGRDSLSGYTKESTQASNPVYGVWGANKQSSSTSVTDAKKTVVVAETKNVPRSLAYYCGCRKICWKNKGGKCGYCNGKTTNRLTMYSSKSLAGSGYKKDSDGSYFLPTRIALNAPGKMGEIYVIGWNGEKATSFTTGSKVGGKNTYMWPDGTATIYRTKTTTYVNTFSKWGEWSSWRDGSMNGSGSRQVETRTVYRYRDYVEVR